MAARVNGETWTSGDSSDMLHHFEDIIAFVTRSETIFAGEFIGSGTMSSGCGLELDRYLANGDTIEIEVEKIGILRNRIEGSSKIALGLSPDQVSALALPVPNTAP